MPRQDRTQHHQEPHHRRPMQSQPPRLRRMLRFSELARFDQQIVRYQPARATGYQGATDGVEPKAMVSGQLHWQISQLSRAQDSFPLSCGAEPMYWRLFPWMMMALASN